jgi:hypothetical protein
VVTTTTTTDAASLRRKTRLISLARDTLRTPKEKREASTAQSIGNSDAKKNPPAVELKHLREKTLVAIEPE